MSSNGDGSGRVERLLRELARDAEASGYHLNPDPSFTRPLVEGLVANEERYGYRSCPCRLAAGARPRDLDIMCPCDYRDQDLAQWGSCYCALYVSEAVSDGREELRPVPERRPDAAPPSETPGDGKLSHGELDHPVWRCRVCGYLCAREEPPERCPICKASKDRFERFL